MGNEGLTAGIAFQLGPLQITYTVVTTWVIMAVLTFVCWLATRRLQIEPGLVQTAMEGIVSTIKEAIHGAAPDQTRLLLPFIGTLWAFLVIANLSGLIPGVHSPTRDLSATAALAFLVFRPQGLFGEKIIERV